MLAGCVRLVTPVGKEFSKQKNRFIQGRQQTRTEKLKGAAFVRVCLLLEATLVCLLQEV